MTQAAATDAILGTMNRPALILSLVLVSCAASPSGPPSLTRSGDVGGERALIWTSSVDLGIETDAMEGTIAALSDMSRSLGGYAEEQSLESIVIRVPAARFDEALAGIGKHGDPIRRSVSAQDVTMRKSDLGVRVDNLRRLQARLKELAAQGANVHELLEVEKELGRVTRARGPRGPARAARAAGRAGVDPRPFDRRADAGAGGLGVLCGFRTFKVVDRLGVSAAFRTPTSGGAIDMIRRVFASLPRVVLMGNAEILGNSSVDGTNCSAVAGSGDLTVLAGGTITTSTAMQISAGTGAMVAMPSAAFRLGALDSGVRRRAIVTSTSLGSFGSRLIGCTPGQAEPFTFDEVFLMISPSGAESDFVLAEGARRDATPYTTSWRYRFILGSRMVDGGGLESLSLAFGP